MSEAFKIFTLIKYQKKQIPRTNMIKVTRLVLEASTLVFQSELHLEKKFKGRGYRPFPSRVSRLYMNDGLEETNNFIRSNKFQITIAKE